MVGIKKISFVLTGLIVSAGVHAVIFFCLPFYIKVSKKPYIFSWLDVLDAGDLHINAQNISLPEWEDFSPGDLRKNYFSFDTNSAVFFDSRRMPVLAEKRDIHPSTSIDDYFRPGTDLLYLWETSPAFIPDAEETVSYKALVSPHGKIIFSYPERLPVNSQGNLYLQEYIRESTFFLNDKIFWTKLEGVVK